MIYLVSFCGHTNDQKYIDLRKYSESDIVDSKYGVEVAHGMGADFLDFIPNMWEEYRMGSGDRHYSPSSVLTYRVPKMVWEQMKDIDNEEDEYGNLINSWNLLKCYKNAHANCVVLSSVDY